jgi:endonuclease-3
MPKASDDKRITAHQKQSRFHSSAMLQLLRSLETVHPEAGCALPWRTPFELLVATILSAQCTDERVNAVTPTLFRRFPDAQSMAAAEAAEIESLIHSTGFYRSKAKSLLLCSRALAMEHGGRVPSRMEDLVRLPGVGRKTANIVLGHAFNKAEGIAVDTHVLRVARRLGLTAAEDPQSVEADLTALVPRQSWTRSIDLSWTQAV